VLPTLRLWKEVPRNDPLYTRLMLHLTNQHTSQHSFQSSHFLLWMLTVTTFTSDTCFGNDGKHSSSWKAQHSLKHCHPHQPWDFFLWTQYSKMKSTKSMQIPPLWSKTKNYEKLLCLHKILVLRYFMGFLSYKRRDSSSK
jgi:hypothetical protein